MTHDSFGNAAEQGPLHAPASVTADDDDISGSRLGGLDDLRGGPAGL